MAAAEEGLREAKRMESVARVVGGVTHHFNNLLAVIQGNLEMMSDSLAPGDRMKQFAEAAQNVAEDAAEINRKLVSCTRHQALHPELCGVDDLLDDFGADLAGEMGGRHHLDIQAPTSPRQYPPSTPRRSPRSTSRCVCRRSRARLT